MPGPVQKFVVFAATDGLILQPCSPRRQHHVPQIVHIEYSSHSITRPDQVENAANAVREPSLEVHGVVGP